MKKWIRKHRALCRMTAFALAAAVVLEGLSWLALALDRNHNPVLNCSSSCLFDEPKNSLDVLTIGTSDVYSSVQPLEWWHRYGYAGYTWGQPSQRIFETYAYLKKIYTVQNPKVVFLEIGDLYRDANSAQVLDSVARTYLGQLFPVILYHRNFNPAKFANLGASRRSVTKGYLLRTDTVASDGGSYMRPCKKDRPIHPLCVRALKDCIDLCRAKGSTVVLLSVPDRTSWNTDRHNAVAKLAARYGVDYLDLNVDLQREIDWKRDTADGGMHMNYRGAQKVSDYLGRYLNEHFTLTDHRGETAYALWNNDYRAMLRAVKMPWLYTKKARKSTGAAA